MQTLKGTEGRYDTLVECYDSPAEFMNVMKTRDTGAYDTLNRERASSPNWAGYKDTQEMLAKFQAFRVDSAKLKPIKTAFRKADNGEDYQRRIEIYRTCGGFRPCIPAYLNGDPMDMYNVRILKKPIKTFRIFLNTSSGGESTTQEIINAGSALIRAISAIEKRGDRVELRAGWLAKDSNRNGPLLFGMSLLLKRADQPMDIARIAWPAVNPSFLRGVCQGWADRTGVIDSRVSFDGNIWRSWSQNERDIMCTTMNASVYTMSELIEEVRNHGTDATSEAILNKVYGTA